MADPADDPTAPAEAALARLAPAGRVGIAVSGGGDSMALLALAHGWAARQGRTVSAVTVDHGLRSGSAGEAAFVARFCASLGVAHATLRLGALAGGNLQAAAREARYRAMADWSRETSVGTVLLGHTLDDQAETLLMRLARGSGVEGLSAMAERRDWLGASWARPLLEVRRAALRTWLSDRGIAWVDDPTNDDPAYDRVKARRALAALAPLGISAEGLSRTGHRLSRQRAVLERAAEETRAQALRCGAFGEIRLSLVPLRAAESDTALRVFADALVRVAGCRYRPRFRSVEPLLARLMDGERTAATLGGCLVVPCAGSDSVLICREPAAADGPLPLTDGDLWDGRWRLVVPEGSRASLSVGALGAAGCDRLAREARSGAWQPPSAWFDAPRVVRETLPAVFARRGRGAEAIVAVPPAGYISGGAARAGVNTIRAAPLAPAATGRMAAALNSRAAATM